MAIHNVLIANRGEIAVRIARSAQELGYRTVAVYSDADAHSPHVVAADRAVAIGPAKVSESYLNIPKLLWAAREAGADAVHPGYGLLSESAEFARQCERAGLVFVGPPVDCIALMGDKAAARAQAQQAGLPCLAGYDGGGSEADFVKAAADIGYPVMVKAAAGGGGRGMRRAASQRELERALPLASREAEAAFGDGRLLLERAIEHARHIEVQVLADGHGHVVHLGERDCTVQRRFQKVIEECPSPAVDDALRARLGEAAVSLARAVGYRSAGTVEFLLDADGRFYFLEMNTRLQVEHAVTELVTGADLVGEQLRVADGGSLSVSQGDVRMQGHAIEARLYAEDAAAGFLPQAGRVARFVAPAGEGVRVDHALARGVVVSAHYDPMLAKVVAHGRDRAQALRRLDRALSGTVLLGLRHNRDFLRRVLSHEAFVRASIDTGFLGDTGKALLAEPAVAPWDLAAGALALLLREAGSRDFGALLGFANARPLEVPFRLVDRQHQHDLVLRCSAGAFEAEIETAQLRLTLAAWDASDGRLVVSAGGVRRAYRVAFGEHHVELDGGRHCMLFDQTRAAKRDLEQAGGGRVTSPIEASVVDVLVRPGDEVARGDTLVVLEAMKLQHAASAAVTGRVVRVAVDKGAQVEIGQLLVELEAAPA